MPAQAARIAPSSVSLSKILAPGFFLCMSAALFPPGKRPPHAFRACRARKDSGLTPASAPSTIAFVGTRERKPMAKTKFGVFSLSQFPDLSKVVESFDDDLGFFELAEQL